MALVTGVGDDNVRRCGGGDMAIPGRGTRQNWMPAVQALEAVEAREAAFDLVDVWLGAAVQAACAC